MSIANARYHKHSSRVIYDDADDDEPIVVSRRRFHSSGSLQDTPVQIWSSGGRPVYDWSRSMNSLPVHRHKRPRYLLPANDFVGYYDPAPAFMSYVGDLRDENGMLGPKRPPPSANLQDLYGIEIDPNPAMVMIPDKLLIIKRPVTKPPGPPPEEGGASTTAADGASTAAATEAGATEAAATEAPAGDTTTAAGEEAPTTAAEEGATTAAAEGEEAPTTEAPAE